MPHRENETRRRRRAIECCAESLVCCDDPKCALPADCCADADCCKPKAGGAIRSTKSFKSRPAARLPALNKRLVAACICLGVAACALCLPVVSAGGGHGGELRPGFLKCEIEESGEEHCETDYEALAEHCSELELDEYNLGLHVGAVFIQIGVSFIGCMIPIVAKKWTALKVSDFNFSLFKHFGAGIILATGFIHMLPPAFSNLTNICLPDSWLEYPFAGLLAMLAVLFTQFVQTMAVSYLKDFETPKSEIAPSAVANKGINEMEKHADSTAASTTDGTLILDTRTPAEKDLETHAAHPGHGHDHGHSAQELMDVEHTHNLILAHRHRRQITVYILEMGIATHSFIIGLALGVSRGSEMTALMIALAFHQFFEGMALSATVLDAGFKTLFAPIFMVCFYSLTTPLGIAIGIGINESFMPNSTQALLALGIIDALAAGILIYDACVNLITANMTNSPSFIKQSGGKKALAFFAFWLAVALMSLIGKWA